MGSGEANLNPVEISFEGQLLKLDNAESTNGIVHALDNSLDMTCLRLSGNTLGIEAAEEIGRHLRQHKKLKSCHFNDLFTGRSKNEIAPALEKISEGIFASNAKLVELDLSDNAFGPNGIIGVTKLLSSEACYSLEILRMNNLGLGHAGCQQLVDALLSGRESSRGLGLKLKVFWAARNRLENFGICLLSDFFSDIKSLEELILFQNGIGLHGLDGIKKLSSSLKANTHMRVLNLSDNSLTARGSKSIAAVLPFLPNLEILQIDDCLIRSAGADYLSSVLDDNACVPKLQELHLSGNEISRDAAVRLVLSLSTKRHLRYLNLNTNELGSKGIDDVIQAMASIGILHTVFRNGMLKNDQGNITKDVALEAFDDDQGSESEESEDPDEAEGYESRSDDYSDLADADITKLKVTNQSSSAFSFTATLEMLKQTQELSKTSNGPRNESKRNTDSLFSDVPTQGSYTNLFAPPKLTYPSSTSVIPKNDECEITTALVDCLSSESGTLIAFVRLANLILGMESVFLTSSSTYESKIKDLLNRNKTTPERVVRLALRLLLHKKTPGCAALERFSEMILKLVLTQTDRSDEGNVQNDEGLCASRAANCVLVHLGAIKRERNASSSSEVDSDEDPIKSPNKTIEHPGSVLAVIQRIIDSHGTSMPAVVARSLSIMLMECRDKLKSDIERDEERPSNENILDRLVESLELQLNQINIHEKQ